MSNLVEYRIRPSETEGDVLTTVSGEATWAAPAGGGGGSSLNFTGPWDSATTYAVDDVVTFGGSSWVAIAASTDVEPVEGASWTLLAAKGDTGATGPVASVVAGTGIAVDDTDPANPVVSATGGGGGGGAGSWTFYGEDTTAGAAALTVSSIPTGVTELRIVVDFEWPAAGGTVHFARLRFNGDGGNNYVNRRRSLISGPTGGSAGEDGLTLTFNFQEQASTHLAVYDVTKRAATEYANALGHIKVGGAAIDIVDSAGQWQNTTDEISSVSVLSGTANNIIGRLRVYGR